MRNKLAPLWNLHRSVEILRCANETKQWVSLTSAYLGVRDLTYPYPLKIRGMETVDIEEVSDVWAFWQIFLRRVYDVRGNEKFIIDAGANIGFFTLWAARCAPRSKIFAIEPVPATYDRLCENVRRNGLVDRVSCLNVALAGVSELRSVRVGQPRSQAQRVLPSDCNATGGLAKVRTATLAQVFTEHSLTSVDLLKMDIEGGEFETILSSPNETLSRIGRISLEYHPDVEGYTTEHLLSYLRQAGFAVQSDVRNREGYGVALLQNSRS